MIFKLVEACALEKDCGNARMPAQQERHLGIDPNKEGSSEVGRPESLVNFCGDFPPDALAMQRN